MGYIQKNNTIDISSYPSNIVFAMVTLGVLSVITHVRTFIIDKVIIRRELDSKLSIFPFYIAYNVADFLWMSLIPMVFVIPYYYIVYPHTSFMDFYAAALMVCWWCSGQAYLISAFPIALHWANLIAVFVTIIMGAFLQGLSPTIADSVHTLQGAAIHMSFNRWAMEVLVIKEFTFYDRTHTNVVWLMMDKIGLCGMRNQVASLSEDDIPGMYYRMRTSITDECSRYIARAFLWMFGFGAIFRVLALAILYVTIHPIIQRFLWKIFFWRRLAVSFWGRIISPPAYHSTTGFTTATTAPHA